LPKVLFAALALALAAPAAAKKHPFTIEDLLAMQRLADPQPSPDGKWIAYTVTTIDLGENKGRADLWLVSSDGATRRRLTTHPDKDSSPRFSADGKVLYFLSGRGGSAQVWRIPVDGGEAEQVTSLPLDVTSVTPVPGSTRLVLTMEVYPDAATLEETKKRDQAKKDDKVKALAYEQLLFRHWDTWEDGKRSHLFVWEPGKAPVDLMKGIDADTPTLPFGGAEDIAVTPDGKTAVYVARSDGRAAAWSTNTDLYAVALDGKSKPINLTADNPAEDGAPVFSPDGKTLAYLAMARPGYESDRRRVVLYDWARKQRRVLTDAWDRSPGELAWSHNGKLLYATADHLGNHALFAVDVQSGEALVLGPTGYHAAPRALPTGVVYLRDTLSAPAELYARTGPDERALSAHSAARVAEIEWGAYEQFSFPGARGETVHGYLMRPAGHKGQKVPVAFLIHGGPQGSFGNHFHYRWNPQVYAGHGLAAVFIDFHGSTGYGQAFTDSIRGDWGGAPYEDLMKGLDHALAKYPFLDKERLAGLGASYGGYMINWINGNTDRFKALVCHDGNLDELTAYFMTEELWFPEWERKGAPWENPEGYRTHNPLARVDKWKTPTLVIHGANDFRVVDTQGLATFTALQRRGVASRLVYFPDENHWVQKPLNSRRWHEEVLAWLDRFVTAKKK
jgi:dipeptidyl aminopeptidase/acylaminoacyl peptidase